MSQVSDDKEDDTDADDEQVDLVSILGLLLYSCYQLPEAKDEHWNVMYIFNQHVICCALRQSPTIILKRYRQRLFNSNRVNESLWLLFL